MSDKIEQWVWEPIAKLKPNPNNRNIHPKEQITRIAELLKYQGWRAAIVVSNRSGLIVAGHGRLLAAKKLKMEKVPVHYQDFDSEEQEYAHSIADNAIPNWATLDLSNIHLDIQGMDPTILQLDMLGIQDFRFEPPASEAQCDEDHVPEYVEPKARLGDIYKLGEHRLMCGDSTNIQNVELLMDGDKADAVYTDPPYGMSLDTNYDKMFSNDKNHKSKGDRFEKIISDDRYFDPQEVLAVCTEVSEVFLWGADYFYDSLPRGGSLCAWDKRTENLDRVVGNTTEFLWSKRPHRRMTARVLWSGHHGMGKDDDKKRIHPTQKPVTLHEWFFDSFGGEFKTILDLFGGSGSTLIACEKTKRRCFMIEIDPKYIDVIVARWEKYTGKKAELLTQPFPS